MNKQGYINPFLNHFCFSVPQMAASPDEHHYSPHYKQKKFTWGYGTNTYWKSVKVHPESGCLMTTTDITHPDNNPCAAEHQLSLTCLEKSRDRDGCQPYFENYRTCVKFWRQVVKQRRARGEEPPLPPPALREQMKKEFLSKESHSFQGH